MGVLAAVVVAAVRRLDGGVAGSILPSLPQLLLLFMWGLVGKVVDDAVWTCDGDAVVETEVDGEEESGRWALRNDAMGDGGA